MKAFSLPGWTERVSRWAWVFLMASLTVSSFPFLPAAMGGGTIVRPLAIYPLAVLMGLVTLPRLFTRPLPRTLLALLPFVIFALASSLISFVRGVEPAMGISVEDRVLRAVLTLAIGIGLYLTVALYPQTRADLRFGLKALYAGFAAALLWGSLQAINILHMIPSWFALLNQLQRLISTRKLFPTRISGPTYEPNWFAEQISFLLLPWLVASVLSGTSVFGWRWRGRVTVEALLLAWAVLLLPLTFSRAGLFNLVILVFVSLLFFRLQAAHPRTVKAQPLSHKLLKGLLQAGLALALIAGLVYAAGTRNEFFARLWGYWTQKQEHSLTGYFEYLGFGARFTYGEAALNTYLEYPVLGVGLGNYAFYFEEMLPNRPLAYTVEVLRLITPEEGRNRLITAKNLYFRLLAETGLIGTAAFAAFLVALFGCALYLWMSHDREEKFWGMGGLLGLIVFFPAALSFDSLAIPNMWIVFGWITAAAFVYRQDPAAALEAPEASKTAVPVL